MSDTLEAVALRLREFVDMTEQRAGSLGSQQSEVDTAPSSEPPKDRLLVVYEECLGKLAPEDRGAFARFIETMSGPDAE
jgi:hypothetical protein